MYRHTNTKTTKLHHVADSSEQAFVVIVNLSSKLNNDVKISFVLRKWSLTPIKVKSLTIKTRTTGVTYSGTNKREANQRSKCSSQQIIILE